MLGMDFKGDDFFGARCRSVPGLQMQPDLSVWSRHACGLAQDSDPSRRGKE